MSGITSEKIKIMQGSRVTTLTQYSVHTDSAVSLLLGVYRLEINRSILLLLLLGLRSTLLGKILS